MNGMTNGDFQIWPSSSVSRWGLRALAFTDRVCLHHFAVSRYPIITTRSPVAGNEKTAMALPPPGILNVEKFLCARIPGSQRPERRSFSAALISGQVIWESKILPNPQVELNFYK
jgi:hypothetical protein